MDAPVRPGAAGHVVRDLVILGGALVYHYTVGRYDMAPTLVSKLK